MDEKGEVMKEREERERKGREGDRMENIRGGVKGMVEKRKE